MIRIRRGWVWIASVVALLPFLPSVGYGFLYEWDDANFILENPYIGLSWTNLLHNFSTNLQTVYTPFATLSLMIDHALYGTWAPGYHLTHLVMFAGCVALLFCIQRRLRLPPVVALFLVLLWAWNPGKCETVAWISDRKGLGSTLFALGAFLSFMYDCKSDRVQVRTLLLMLVAFLFKPSALPLPWAMALYAWCYFHRDLRRILKIFFPVFIVGLLGGILVSAMTFSELSSSRSFDGLELFNFLRYFGAAVWPLSLNPVHPRPTVAVILPEIILGLVCLGMVILVGVKSRIPLRSQLAFLGSFVGMGLPLLSSGALTYFSYAERYNFLLSVVVWSWIGVAGRSLFLKFTKAFCLIAVMLLGGYFLTDCFYLDTYSDTQLMFARAVAIDHPSQRALEGLGEVGINRHRPDLLLTTAELFASNADKQSGKVAIQYRNTAVLVTAYAKLMLDTGSIDELVGVLGSVKRDDFAGPEIFLFPAYALATGKLVTSGRTSEAKELLEKQVADRSGVEFQLHFASGLAGYLGEDWDRAEREWQRVLDLKPNDTQTRRNLESIKLMRRKHESK